ncbi:MAG: rhodanese-like domain-containing protein [Methanothrix sp.]|nr:rhodanese-like domain-containing protein [Methanothrix sp.]
MDILKIGIGIIFGALVAIMALLPGTCAGAECSSLGGACDDGGWDPMAKLDEIGTGNYDDQPQASPKWPNKSRELRWNMSSADGQDSKEGEVAASDPEKTRADAGTEKSSNRLHEIMVEIDEVSSSDVLLDVSESATEHISGSLAIPYEDFMEDDLPKSVEEIAEILGHAGITENDSLILYGECLPCGGGPSVSAYAYWIMKFLGHEKVRVLNGYVRDWKERGLPVSSSAIVLPAAKYTPQFTDKLVADYEYVKSGQPQLVDARTVQEFGSGTIPGAISIPYESVLDGDVMKNPSNLEKSFSILDKERPVVAFTNTGFKGSVVRLALEIMGYDARLYSYNNWMDNQLAEQEIKLVAQNAEAVQVPPESDPAPSNLSIARTGAFARALANPTAVLPEEVVLDISPSAARYIEGSVNINYEGFFEKGGRLKSVSEMATLLGEAGISRNDSLVISGECLPCGGGPSPAIFTYWLLKYLGHEKVRVLDGGIDDWTAAGLNTSSESATRPKTDYIPALKPELFANYDFVLNGGAQIVDARPTRDYGIGSIPGALNIPYESVVKDERVKPQEDLQKIFAVLDRERPVVVYTNVGVEASLVWFALTISGYDARLYTWLDWLENQPKFGYELAEIEANPNPVRSGQATSITASFREKQPAGENPSSNDEVRLTVKGCATCGFGSPQGFANINRSSGIVQIGSSGKTTQSGGVAVQQTDSTMRCTAIVNAPDGSEAARTSLLHTTGDKYMGIWNADAAPGIYKVSLVATASSNAETFADVLEIEVTD